MAVNKDALIEWAKHRGWRLDAWGHLQKSADGKQYRLKLSRIAARYEVKTSSGWMRVRSAYYSQITITPEGKLAGLSHAGCGSPAKAPSIPAAQNQQQGEEQQ